MRWTFDFEATDRKTWPAIWGRLTVLAGSYLEALDLAHDMVGCLNQRGQAWWLPRIEMVTALHCVDWPEEEAA